MQFFGVYVNGFAMGESQIISFSEMKIIEHWGRLCLTYFILLKVHLFFAYVELTDMKVAAGWIQEFLVTGVTAEMPYSQSDMIHLFCKQKYPITGTIINLK